MLGNDSSTVSPSYELNQTLEDMSQNWAEESSNFRRKRRRCTKEEAIKTISHDWHATNTTTESDTIDNTNLVHATETAVKMRMNIVNGSSCERCTDETLEDDLMPSSSTADFTRNEARLLMDSLEDLLRHEAFSQEADTIATQVLECICPSVKLKTDACCGIKRSGSPTLTLTSDGSPRHVMGLNRMDSIFRPMSTYEKADFLEIIRMPPVHSDVATSPDDSKLCASA